MKMPMSLHPSNKKYIKGCKGQKGRNTLITLINKHTNNGIATSRNPQ